MSRFTNVAAARARKDGKQPFRCYTCREEIQVGQAYTWTQANRFSSRYNWHQECAAPPPSALEGNEKRARAMEAFESAYAALYGVETDGGDAEAFQEAVREVLNELAEGIREAAEMWREGADNIENGFGHTTSQSEEMVDQADNYDSLADEVENLEADEYDAEAWESFEQWANDYIDTIRNDIGNSEEY